MWNSRCQNCSDHLRHIPATPTRPPHGQCRSPVMFYRTLSHGSMSNSMPMVELTEQDLANLRAFHQAHFPSQPVPVLKTVPAGDPSLPNEVEPDLGYYPDGTRRTLTDQQIALFRHSELQRLLKARQRRRDQEGRQRSDVTASNSGSRSRPPSKALQPISSTRYDTDATTHARMQAQSLAYDDDEKELNNHTAESFQWPILGSTSGS